MTEVVVVGAGPAGMSAALELHARGMKVTVVDDQPAPGGRIFAAIESRAAHNAEDEGGAALVARFRQAGGCYLPSAEVWQIEPGPKVFLTRDGRASMIEPDYVVLTSGAQERPMPFPGWQLPGVMTVGAAQILLKTARQIPDEPVWLAGTGPLLLLYAHQLIASGGSVAGILDTQRPGRLAASAAKLPSAFISGWRDLLRGLSWQLQMRGVRVIRHVVAIEAIGTDRVASVEFTTSDGSAGTVTTDMLLVHDGVVPAIHGTLAAGCDHRWNAAQGCFEPVIDEFGASSVPAVYVAGDGATVGGARAAALSGRRAAIGIARASGVLSETEASSALAPTRRQLGRSGAFRRFIDSLYPPTEMPIPDDTIVCRCEEVTAGRIRGLLASRPQMGPDAVKIATRAGMGPCQGRQCGATLTRLVSETRQGSQGDVGFLRIRPPLKPLTVGELATLDSVS